MRALTNVVVYDSFTEELMIEGICVYWSTVLTETYDYAFTYDPYANGGNVEINGVPEGKLDYDGVEITGTGRGDISIYWMDSSVKAHLKWEIGDMTEGESKFLVVIVLTDTNPAGEQEFTTSGKKVLNCGAIVKARKAKTGYRVYDKSNAIVIEVEGGDSGGSTFLSRLFSYFRRWRRR